MMSDSPTIMVVEDDRDSLRLLSSLLKQSGYRVRTIPDGSLVMPSVHLAPPDLILLDIIMPDPDGYAVCRQLKAEAGTREIPIIFLSAKHEVMDKVRAFSMGGVDYITKPFEEAEVLARVHTHLLLTRTQRHLQDVNTALFQEIEQRKKAEAKQERLICELKAALTEVKTLTGLLPICARCKKIRDSQDYWHQVESYISARTNVDFSHSICPECARILYPELYGEDPEPDPGPA